MRKELTALETLEVTERIQHAWLAGMEQAMVDETGKSSLPVFQGGTCLHLVYGSPRFSQDMDFMISSVHGLNERVQRAADKAREVLEQASPGCLDGWDWRLSMRGGGESDLRNPRLYHLTVQAPDWVRSIKIKAEFFLVSEQDMASCATQVVDTLPMSMARTEVGQRLQAKQSVKVCALSIDGLVADKLYAAAAREFSKARDWFDLWWIHTNQPGASVAEMSVWGERNWDVRCSMYQGRSANADETMRQSLLQRCLALCEQPLKRQTQVEEIRQWLIAHPALQSQSERIVDEAAQVSLRVAQRLNQGLAHNGHEPACAVGANPEPETVV